MGEGRDHLPLIEAARFGLCAFPPRPGVCVHAHQCRGGSLRELKSPPKFPDRIGTHPGSSTAPDSFGCARGGLSKRAVVSAFIELYICLARPSSGCPGASPRLILPATAPAARSSVPPLRSRRKNSAGGTSRWGRANCRRAGRSPSSQRGFRGTRRASRR